MTTNEIRKALLAPSSVALIGASDDASRLTARPQRFLEQHGFAGSLFPVNPNRDTVLGRRAYSSISEVPGPVDHATILLNADPALDAVEACAAAGVRVVSVLADGFAEAGDVGLARQSCLSDIAAAAPDMLVIGPNSMGVVTPEAGFVCTTNAAFAADELARGRFAVLSQSGSMIGALLSRGAPYGLGFRHSISVGNEACVGIGELGQLLVDAPEIDGFILFLETIRRPDEVATFAAMAHAVGKPIVAYLVGRSKAGAGLAASHTGAMTSGGRAIEAFLEGHGIVLLDDLQALIEVPVALKLKEQLKGRQKTATVVTTTGGGGGMVFDLLGLKGVPLAGLPSGAQAQLAAEGLDIKQGPIVDVTLAGTQYDVMKAVMTALIAHPDSGLIVPAIGSSAQFNPELAVRPIVDAVAEAAEGGAPVVAVPVPHAPESIRLLIDGGVPAFSSAASCAEAVSCVLSEHQPADVVADTLPARVAQLINASNHSSLNEFEAGQVFRALGVALPQTVLIQPGDRAVSLSFEGPYALKAASRDITHKSDLDLVRLGLESHGDVVQGIGDIADAFERACKDAKLDGFLVQQMETGLGEAIVGLVRDPVVGPLISVGAGGVLAEVYEDVEIRPAPVSVETANRMIRQIKGFAPLRGYRGAPEGDLEALAVAVSRVSLLAKHDNVQDAEINPIVVKSDGIVALDALIRLKNIT